MVAKRRRVRGRLAVGGVAVLGLWIWLGGPGQPEETDDGGAMSAVTPAPPPKLPTDTVEVAVVEPAAPVDSPDRRRIRELQETDRLEGVLYGLRRMVDEGRLGGAFVELEVASKLELETTSLRDRCAAAVRELNQQLPQDVAQLVSLVADGCVAQARAQLRLWRDPAHAAVEKALSVEVDKRGWPAWDSREPTKSPTPPTAPAPLARGRRVRVCHQGTWLVGRVVGATPAETTIEIRTAGGVTYAFVGRGEVDPVSPSLAEAVEQGFAGLRAGDLTLAAMWLSHCLERAGAAADGGARRLRSALDLASQRASRPR